MQFEEEEGAVAVSTATDDDNEVRQTSSFEAQGFDSPYLKAVRRVKQNLGGKFA
ncbi:hypothetical protein SDC9_136192 [bioreactor metagenome]|uniref:Uncharacterized protein n=1 Tax=bioreactor metagenome TaxID=1076179 RepID=A0A645DHW4_9ZZZZ